ncbi:hypothetical protein GCM10018781_65010 [Kitasatospora indigofera]|uniref:Uncharacterized protein n=1 Tax=Kitasatospora indigofera TaxID=67307 RepID=A0A919GCN8_9ACTN|nr:hypothetical protein [Kitasatospora indigofera]GHH81738.1 hypothetical protein GCM10018781_65010 [Kitasatospora indigofera]
MGTDEPLSEDELSAIERRVAAASPGPWVGWLESRHGIGGSSFIELPGDVEVDDELYLTRATGGRRVGGAHAQTDADIDFIAGARQDVPRLVSEVRRLRAALEEARSAD